MSLSEELPTTLLILCQS